MALIYSQDIISVTAGQITTTGGVVSGYAAVNVFDMNHYGRSYMRAAPAPPTWPLPTGYTCFDIDFGAAQVVTAIAVFGANFSTIGIRGDTLSDFSVQPYATNFTGGANAITGRPHAYLTLSGFNYRYMRITAVSGSTQVGTYGTYLRINTLCLMETVTELSTNMSYGFSENTEQFYSDVLGSRVTLADGVRWSADLPFGNRASASATELWTMNQIDMSEPFVFYINDSDTSEVYLCRRDNSFSMARNGPNHVTGNTVRIKEIFNPEFEGK